MEEEEEEVVVLHSEIETDDDDDDKEKRGREICVKGCGRPSKVCVCGQLPKQPISTWTHVLILQHPHEVRHKLATVPILSKCLSNSQTIVGRRLCLGSSPLLDALHDGRVAHRAIFLFPGGTDLNEWASSSLPLASDSNNKNKKVVLIVLDGTWKHAKEMVKASLPFLSKFATQVCFAHDFSLDGDSKFDSELVLRKEPFSGCMSTIEAVARALRILESPTAAIHVEQSLISVLKAMVHFQALYLNNPSKNKLLDPLLCFLLARMCVPPAGTKR